MEEEAASLRADGGSSASDIEMVRRGVADSANAAQRGTVAQHLSASDQAAGSRWSKSEIAKFSPRGLRRNRTR